MISKKFTQKVFMIWKLLAWVPPIFERGVRITEIGDTRITEDSLVRVTELSP